MEKRLNRNLATARWRVVLVLGVLTLLIAGATQSNYVPSGYTQDSRLRRSVTTVATPTPTPLNRSTPTPSRPVSNSTPQSIPAPSVPPAGAVPPQTTTTGPAPTPTPTPVQVPVDRTIPQLGEPPPIPKLKPKPTPTPPEEFGEGEIVRVDTELVTLNVRVIDRNNRPIDNVRENELHVIEDGVEQPIVFFTREEVPISYGVAVDTSGSLRSQLQSVIDAGKTIINTNKPGDETFLVRFISSDKIETVQDFTSNQDLLIDALDSLYVEGGQKQLSMRCTSRPNGCQNTKRVMTTIAAVAR